MNRLKSFALGAVAVTVISLFLPWLEVSASSGSSDVSVSFQPIIISGISIGYGIIGLLVALTGAYLAYKENKWTFLAGVFNFINGYGYLHKWFGAGTRDSGNYGDVTSRSSVDPQYGIYVFIFASIAFIIFTLKYYKQKKAETTNPLEPEQKRNQQPAFTTKNTAASQVYQPSKIQTMTTSTSETPMEPVPSETPKVPATPADKAPEQPLANPVEPAEPVLPVETPAEQPVPTVPVATPAAPVQAVVTEPAPVFHQPQHVTSTPQPPYVEPEKKKSSTTKILLIILAIVLVGAAAVVLMTNSSDKSKDKTEQSVNDEKARLEIIINEVNQSVSDKKYDEALLKINSINWLYEPEAHKGYVDQYNSQRENLRNTIEQLKSTQSMDEQRQAPEKVVVPSEQTAQPGDSIH